MRRDEFRKWVGLAALLLPLVALAAIAFCAAGDRRNGDKWLIEIAGYDPRDPLHGHYLNYRYVWNWRDGAPATLPNGAACLCLHGAAGLNPPVSLYRCDDSALKTCTAHIEGTFDGQDFRIGRMQYFIPEEYAGRLEDLLRGGKNKFHVELVTTRRAQAVTGDLYIDQNPWLDFFTGSH